VPHTPYILAQEILHYLIRHPDAKDTLEGVLRWWISRDSKATAESLRSALDQLVDKGWVRKQQIAKEENLYSLIKSATPAIVSFLDVNSS